MHYIALIMFVAAVSCGVIRDDQERMKREINPDLLTIALDRNQNLASDSLVQGTLSEADFQRAVQDLGKQTEKFANDLNKQLQEALQPNAAQTASVSTRVLLGVVTMTVVKMFI